VSDTGGILMKGDDNENKRIKGRGQTRGHSKDVKVSDV